MPSKHGDRTGRKVQEVIAALLNELGASRVTVRQPKDDGRFHVTFEALAEGVATIRGLVSPNQHTQPVVQEVLRGNQVVQDDCRHASDSPDFQEMLRRYGGLRAQIVTPIVGPEGIEGILSVHQLGAPRAWTSLAVAACQGAATEIGDRWRARSGEDAKPNPG